LNKPLIDLIKNSDIDFSKRGWRIAVSELIRKKKNLERLKNG
jgi:hypothetical protein